MVMKNFLRNKNIIMVFSKVENNWEGLQVKGGGAYKRQLTMLELF